MNINTTTEYININNFRQNIMTISSDDSNPVLLIVHGGAGSPDRPLVKKYNSELAEYYTVVCWDQRGSGLSYTKEDLTIDIILNDLKSVVEFLRNRYNQDKIYIAGHSWGAYLGLRFSFTGSSKKRGSSSGRPPASSQNSSREVLSLRSRRTCVLVKKP